MQIGYGDNCVDMNTVHCWTEKCKDVKMDWEELMGMTKKEVNDL